MLKYSKRFKVNMVRYFLTKRDSLMDIARRKKVSRQTLYRWLRFYQRLGVKGLESKKVGAKSTPINEEHERLILQLWENKNRSAYRMRIDLKAKGYNISERQIMKIYKKNGLKV